MTFSSDDRTIAGRQSAVQAIEGVLPYICNIYRLLPTRIGTSGCDLHLQCRAKLTFGEWLIQVWETASGTLWHTVISGTPLVLVHSIWATNMPSVLMDHRGRPHVVLQDGGHIFDHTHGHAYCKGSIPGNAINTCMYMYMYPFCLLFTVVFITSEGTYACCVYMEPISLANLQEGSYNNNNNNNTPCKLIPCLC